MSSSSIAEKTPRVVEEASKYPKPPQATNHVFQYGTAGFRDEASLLGSTCHRMGMLAVLRSKCEGKITGVMITASHNPVNDNGLKLIDSRGEMLIQSWEKYATQLANATHDKVVEILDAIVAAEKIDLDQSGNVFIARDSRQSGEYLAELAREGALVIGGNVLDFGLQTTPQLHHLVRMWNYEQYNKGDWASEVGYYNMLADGFKQLTCTVDAKKMEMRTPLYVDCAHGVGAIQLSKLAKELGESLHLEIINTPSDGTLNEGCGAEHVQKGKKPPLGMNRETDRNKRFCSMDGDGDRVVFHYYDNDGVWHLLDGDMIATLMAVFIQDRIRILELDKEGITFGVVQTAYANGASTAYLKSKGIRVVQAKTGVKYCHAKACEYDIGMYFEANGHGTVLFKDGLIDKLHKWETGVQDERKKQALSQILATYQLMNQAIGDAMSDLLMVEVLLIQKNWSISDWIQMYTDLPSRQTKVVISDRARLIMEDNDDTLISQPVGLNQALHETLQSYKSKQGRAFIRPSGTEDVVRVYAEAATQADADALALTCAKLVHQHAGGVGSEPTTFIA